MSLLAFCFPPLSQDHKLIVLLSQENDFCYLEIMRSSTYYDEEAKGRFVLFLMLQTPWRRCCVVCHDTSHCSS